MPSGALKLVFPNGDSEYRLTQKELRVGDVLDGRGQSWVVAEVLEELDGASIVRLRSQAEEVVYVGSERGAHTTR